jgi:tetratricopeptide (TPR) repeat protein
MENVLQNYAVDPQLDRKEAVRLMRLALSLDDGDPVTLAEAALISALLVGDCETEIEIADRAVTLNPNSHRAWNCRGWVYNVAGQPEEAIRSFERAMRMSPVDPQQFAALNGMGLIAGKKALRHKPCYSGPYRCLASAFAHLGRDAEAREAAARVLEIDPAFTISAWIARSQLSKNAKLMIEGFRKAGLTE